VRKLRGEFFDTVHPAARIMLVFEGSPRWMPASPWMW
jgi:hypothetical protein